MNWGKCEFFGVGVLIWDELIKVSVVVIVVYVIKLIIVILCLIDIYL